MSAAGWVMAAVILLTIAAVAFLVWSMVRSIHNERTGERSVWREFGLGILLMTLFFAAWLGQAVAQWQEAMTLNFTRQRQLAHKLLDQMMARKWGRIINLTGKSEPEGLNGASAAKAAMHSWAKGLSREVGKHGITVNCIPPGRILSEQILRNYTPEYRKWQSEHEMPVGEYGQPEDIANLVCFLASPKARYITGAVIPVDGGLRRYQF